MLAWKDTTATTTTLAQPVMFRNRLHWDLGSDAGMLVFDTVAESFSLMCRPADATKSCTRLCDMEGSIGFSCFVGAGKTFATRERFGHPSTILECHYGTSAALKICNIWFCPTREMCWCTVATTVTCVTVITPASCYRNSNMIHGA
jgi:hypothetical protein